MAEPMAQLFTMQKKYTLKECIVFYAVYGDADAPTQSFSFGSDDEKVEFVNYFISHIHEFAIPDGNRVFVAPHVSPTMRVLHFSSLDMDVHHMFKCETTKDKLFIAGWMEDELDKYTAYEVTVACMHCRFDAQLVRRLLMDKLGVQCLTDAIIAMVLR